MFTDEAILSLQGDQLLHGKIGIRVLPSVDACMKDMAEAMCSEILQNNQANKPTLLILPVGPVMQYPYFVSIVNQDEISLKNVTLINMDEYMEDEENYLSETNPLSFRRFMRENCYEKINDDLLMPETQRIFPSINNEQQIDEIINAHGGVDVCFGGIGINGHVAFNEPPEDGSLITDQEYRNLSVRLQKVSIETKVINSINDLGGAYDLVPDLCITIGFKQIFQAKKVRLYCFRSWQKAVIRKAAFGRKTASFPVSLLQDHPDVEITIPNELI